MHWIKTNILGWINFNYKYYNLFYILIEIDLHKLDKEFYIFDDNIKFLFIHSEINYSSAGIYTILIKNSNKSDIIKALDLFQKKNTDKRITEILEYIKEVSISQSNLENIYLDVI